MQAIIWTQYGSPEVLQEETIDKPVPKEDEVLIRIIATTVFAGDCELRRSDHPAPFWLPIRLFTGLWKPRIKILGQELAGEIEAVGSKVTAFKPKEMVFAPTDTAFGSYAEYKCLKCSHPIARVPANITCDEAAAIPVGGLNALHFLRKGSVKQDDEVLIHGAGGGIGTFAIQIAKELGATVTALDRTDKLETLKSAGADRVIDYTCEDFTASGQKYDVIIDLAAGSPYLGSVRALKSNGRYVLGNPRLLGMLRAPFTSLLTSKKVVIALAPFKADDLNYLRDLAASGKIKTLIDRRYSLQQITDAHRYVETGQKKGHVIITVASPQIANNGNDSI